MIKRIFLGVFGFIFGRPFFIRFNKALFSLGLRGLGVMTGDRTSEAHFLRTAFKNIGKSSPLVFDVGANVGNFALKIKKAEPEAEVFCFEPHPLTFKLLQANLSSGGFKVFNTGFADIEVRTKLFDYPYGANEGSPFSSMYESVITQTHQQESIGYDADFTTIDAFVTRHDIKQIDLLKMDAEGAEYRILKGATRTIQEGKINIILFEFNKMNIVSRIFLNDFFELLPDFRFYRLLNYGLLPLAKDQPGYNEIFEFQNIAAIRQHTPGVWS